MFNKKFRYPLLVVLFSFCVFASCYTPSLYGVGTAWAGRVQNQIQGFYYLIVLFDIFYIIGYIQDKFSNIESAANLLKDYRIAYQWIMVFLICIIWLGTPNKNTYNSISALRSLITGEAQTYYQENLQRLELYRNPDLKEIVVEPFSVYPKLLVYQDLGTDESDFYYWINLSVADYYGKKKIEMKE